MNGRKKSGGKIYDTYRPYPVSFDFDGERYGPDVADDTLTQDNKHDAHSSPNSNSDLPGDTIPAEWFPDKSPPSNEGAGFRPLRLLGSLFSDRLSFLHSALGELESAKKERKRLVTCALDELDSDIHEADISLGALRAALNSPEQRRHLERRLFELKRERRREALLSWKDLVWLRSETRKIRVQIDTLNRTAGNRDPPR